MDTLKLLILDDNRAYAEKLVSMIAVGDNVDLEWQHIYSVGGFLFHLKADVDLIISSVSLMEINVANALRLVEEREYDIPFILLAELEEEDAAIALVEHGAADYIFKDRLGRLKIAIQQALAQRHWQESRRQSEHYYRYLVDNLPVGLYRVSPAGRFLEANQTLTKMLGFSTIEDLMRENFFEMFVDQEERWLYRKWLQRQGIINNFEMKIYTDDGDVLWVEDNTQVVLDENGYVLYYEGGLRDISSRKQVEVVLRETEQRYRSLFDDAPAMYVVVWFQGDVPVLRDCNTAFLNALGYKREDVIGHSLCEFYSARTQKAMGIEEDCQQLQKGCIPPMECELVASDGRIVDALAYAQAESSEKDRVSSMRIVYIDVTHQKRMEIALASEQKLAALGTFAAGVVHELGSPLQVITGTAERLMKELSAQQETHEQVYKQIDMISKNGWRCADIIDGLRLYAQNATVEFEAVKINDLIKDVLLLVKGRQKLKDGVFFESHVAGDLPALNCNRSQITQVLVNLVSNAIDAVGFGGRVILRGWQDVSEQKMFFAVEDNGSGISDEMLSRVFDPFFTTKEPGSGVGLGLSIAMGIVQAYGGEIQVDSTLEHGTVLTVSFPYVVYDEEMEKKIGALSITKWGGRYEMGNEGALMLKEEEKVPASH